MNFSWMLDVGCWVLDVGCWVLEVVWWKLKIFIVDCHLSFCTQNTTENSPPHSPSNDKRNRFLQIRYLFVQPSNRAPFSVKLRRRCREWFPVVWVCSFYKTPPFPLIFVFGWTVVRRNRTPVSYTHLDVYKRQHLRSRTDHLIMLFSKICLLYTSRCV